MVNSQIFKKLALLLLAIIFCIELFSQNERKEGDALDAVRNYSGAAEMYKLCMKRDVQCLLNFCELIIYRKIKAQFSDELYLLLSPHAHKGNMKAQSYLGWMYFYGFGVEQDYYEAAIWLNKSSEQGHAVAQNNLGWLHEMGWGTPQDYTEAVKWYRKSAEQGNVDAQFNLGLMYERGTGVEQDYNEAAKWYKKSARQGESNAQKNLSDLYGSGKVAKE